MTQQTIEFSHMPSGARGSMAMHHATIGLSLCEGRVPGLHDVPGVRVRPVRPADADTIQEFVRRLSLNSRRSRFFATITELAPATLARFTESTGRGFVLLAEAHDGKTWCMVALAQYALCDGGDDTCEIALVVADAWQQRGLGARPHGNTRPIGARCALCAGRRGRLVRQRGDACAGARMRLHRRTQSV